MYRILAPGITENPIFMHLTDASPTGIKAAAEIDGDKLMINGEPVSLTAAHTARDGARSGSGM